MSDFTLNNLAENIYKANNEKGFYEDGEILRLSIKKNIPQYLPVLESALFGQRIALITSEASEALEADRHNKTFALNAEELFSVAENLEQWKQDMIDNDDEEGFKEDFKKFVKDTREDEVADILIRVLDLCGAMNIDIDFHVQAKLRYNSLRPHKHGKTY